MVALKEEEKYSFFVSTSVPVHNFFFKHVYIVPTSEL